MTPPPDPIAALCTYLESDAGVASVVGTNVFGGSLPKKGDANYIDALDTAAIVVSPAGGPAVMGRTNDFGDLRIDVACYAADEATAYTVYRYVRAAFKNLGRKNIGGVLIHWVKPLTNGTTGIDPETSWPLCLGSFHALAAEVPAA